MRKVIDWLGPPVVGWIVFCTVVLVSAGLLVGCSDKQREFGKDAPRSTHDSGVGEMDVVRGADGFSNVGRRCDDFGNLVYQIYHGDGNYGAVAVVPNFDECTAQFEPNE